MLCKSATLCYVTVVAEVASSHARKYRMRKFMAVLPILTLDSSESDVEQKFITPLLLAAAPHGLGYSISDFRTKTDIKKLTLGKGASRKVYFPDYAIICDGLPLLIVEAKKPGEDLDDAMREARLYATEINATYPSGVNPCERVIATDGLSMIAGYWDQVDPVVKVARDEVNSINPNFDELLKFASFQVIKKE